MALVKTKKKLTNYLALKPAIDLERDLVNVFKRTCLTNSLDLDENLKICGKKEDDTYIVLYAMDVGRRDPFSKLKISCSDTDVLLILLNYFEQLPSATVFKTTDHR